MLEKLQEIGKYTKVKERLVITLNVINSGIYTRIIIRIKNGYQAKKINQNKNQSLSLGKESNCLREDSRSDILQQQGFKSQQHSR